MSRRVRRLFLLTKRFKAFLSLFVNLFFLPLRVKVSTVPVLRYLLRTLVIVVLGMFNSLDSSALFYTDCDRVTINSLVSVERVQHLIDSWELKINSKKQKKNDHFFCDLTLKLMLNDWINEVSKHKQLLFPLIGNYAIFFVPMVGCLIVSFFANFQEHPTRI